MRRGHAIRLFGALLLILVLLSGCTRRTCYTSAQVRERLEEKYHLTLAVEERAAEAGGRVYQVTAAEYPELAFQAWDNWYDGSWDSLLPIYHPGGYQLRDDLQARAWDCCAVPILEEYGLAGLASGSLGDLDSPVYDICYADDLEQEARRLSELLERLRALPVFAEMGPMEEERIDRFSVPVRLMVHPDVGFIYEREDFYIRCPYTEAGIAERLASMRDYLTADLDRKLRRIGISEQVLAPFDPPVVGEDFLVTGDLLNELAEGEAVPAGPRWRGLTEGELLYLCGEVQVEGRRYLSAATAPLSSREAVAGRLFLVDGETGEIWQYGDWISGLGQSRVGFLVRTGRSLTPPDLAELEPD